MRRRLLAGIGALSVSFSGVSGAQPSEPLYLYIITYIGIFFNIYMLFSIKIHN